jgi:hypothetical protein
MTREQFLAALNQMFPKYTFTIERDGIKYTRVVQASAGNADSRSVYCFLDKDGNIYKAASWKAPAKGVRSTLATVDLNKVDPFGGWMYR